VAADFVRVLARVVRGVVAGISIRSAWARDTLLERPAPGWRSGCIGTVLFEVDADK
jgi:hypothetical protein